MPFSLSHLIDGTPGTTWHNDTGRPAYQLICSLFHTCGYCLPLHLEVATEPWPVPFHGHCRCENRYIHAGSPAPFAFVDRRELVKSFDETRRAIAIGKSADRLVRAGVIDLGDLVLPDRVRSIVEVVAKYRIPLRTLIAAGIAASVAERIYHEAKAAAGRDWAAAHRRDLLERIAAAHEAHGAVARHIGATLPIGAAPTGLPVAVGGPTDDRRRHAAELAALLALPPGRRKRKLTPEERRVVEREIGTSAAMSVGAFVAEVAGGLAVGQTYSDAVLATYRRYAAQ